MILTYLYQIFKQIKLNCKFSSFWRSSEAQGYVFNKSYNPYNKLTSNMSTTDHSKKIGLIIQDFNKISILKHNHTPFPKEISILPKITNKRKLIPNMKSQRKNGKVEQLYDSRIGNTKGLTNWGQSLQKTLSNKSFLFQPHQSFQSNSSNDLAQNPQQKLQTHSSMRLNRGTFHRIEKNICQRYQRKIEVLKELKIPKISQQLLTISHFTQEALHSIPKHVEIFNEKLKLLKKSMTPLPQFSQRKEEIELKQMPLELKTLRVIRKSTADKNKPQPSRKSQLKFRMYLTKKSKKVQQKAQIYKIQGWKQQKTVNQRAFQD